MEKLVTLITTTGHRKECFELCKEFMHRQTYEGDVQWIIVDDSGVKNIEEEFRPNWDILNLTPSKLWKEGLNTQRLNLDAAIPYVKGDYVLIIEDDDYYKPIYIETMVKLLKLFPVVGEGNAKYYYWPQKCFKEMENNIHASLCQTGFRASRLEEFEQAVNSGQIYIDIVFWKLIKENKCPHLLFIDSNLTIGMKGLPGRKGIGTGHSPIGYKSDPQLRKLTSWIGEEGVDKYKKIFNNEKKSL